MRMHRLALTVLLAGLAPLLVISPSQATAEQEKPSALGRERVDDFVAGYLARNRLPGATVAVVKDGELVHARGYGEDSSGEQLTETSRLRLGSVSKSFTAFAVLQLVDEGLIGLDDPVTEHLPELRLDDERADEITVRQLLSHTSGIPNPTVVGPADSLPAAVARLREWQLASDPGTKYRYSNANFQVAARLVEELRGRDFADVLAQRVFEPLGMTDSFSTITSNEQVPGGVRRGHVLAYGLAFGTREPEQLVAGSGGVVSTARDMAAWLAMQQRGGTTADGQRLLSTALVKESQEAQEGAGRAGLGWQRSATDSPQRVSTSGLLGSFNAQQDLVPSSGYGVVVLLNSFTYSREHAYEISSGIIEITEGREPAVGPPVPLLIDLGLAALTLLALGLGVRGLLRSKRWSDRRRAWPTWRFALRLAPHLVVPALAGFVLLIAPTLQGNSLTTLDVIRLLPAPSMLLIVLALVGIGLITARAAARLRQLRSAALTSGGERERLPG